MTGQTVVIADDDQQLVAALRKRCEALGLQVRTAFDALQALNTIHDAKPKLICLDVNMPCGNGLSVLEMLANDERMAAIPVIIMTGETNEETIRRCHRLCAYYVPKCAHLWQRIEPVLQDVLDCSPRQSTAPCEQITTRQTTRADSELGHCDKGTSRLQSAPAGNLSAALEVCKPNGAAAKTQLSGREKLVETVFEMLAADPQLLADNAQADGGVNEPPWVLCIDDDPDYSNALKVRLESYGIAVIRAFEGMEGIRFAFTRPADVILLDYAMPRGQGDYVLRRLKDNSITEDIPVIMITGRRDRMLERQVLNMGAAKFMNKPPDFDELLDELRKHIDVLPRAVDVCLS